MRLPSWVAGVVAAAAFTALGTAHAAAACTPNANGSSVFFVTDREPLPDAPRFSGERGIDDKLAATGTAGILAPAAGGIEQRCGAPAAILDALKPGFNEKRGRQLLIYVHGYYTSFLEAAADARAVAAGLDFPGPVILYSWPSKVTSRLAYMTDETNAEWSLPHFIDLLAALQAKYPGIRVSFATHSLGSRFAMNGLRSIRQSSCPTCFGRAVFFAPDVDSATLHAELVASKLCSGAPLLHPVTSAPITIYVSNKDLALRGSQNVHGHQRAGQAGTELILCSGVDTIDVSYRKSDDRAGHSYQTEAPFLADAAAAEAGYPSTSPVRGLKPADRAGGRYYELHDAPAKK